MAPLAASRLTSPRRAEVRRRTWLGATLTEPQRTVVEWPSRCRDTVENTSLRQRATIQTHTRVRLSHAVRDEIAHASFARVYSDAHAWDPRCPAQRGR